MGSNYSRGYSTFGGAEAGSKDKTTVEIGDKVSSTSGENTTIHPNYLNDGDKAGIEAGLSMEMDFNAETEVGPTYNYAEDPMTGNFMERPNPYDQDKTVSSKGKSFNIDR